MPHKFLKAVGGLFPLELTSRRLEAIFVLEEQPVIPVAFHPLAITTTITVLFIFVRLFFGGSGYLPSRAWLVLVFLLPLPHIFFGAFYAQGLCIPVKFDWQLCFHLGLVFLYCWIDLTIGKWMIENDFPESKKADQEPLLQNSANGSRSFGTTNSVMIVAKGLHPLKPGSPMDMGLPSLGRGVFECNGALLHEVFWNIFICQNFMVFGYGDVQSILMVPILSCIVHGITTNWIVGYRCFPQFLWVALSYHASGNVFVPGLIHAMWYFTHSKLLVTLTMFKNTYDIDKRRNEKCCPHADKYAAAGTALIVGFYGALNLIVDYSAEIQKSIFGTPAENAIVLRTLDSHAFNCPETHAGTAGLKPDATGAINLEVVLAYAAIIHLAIGFITWKWIRAGMDVMEKDGDVTPAALERFANNMLVSIRETRTSF